MTDLRRVLRFSKAPDLSTLGSEFLNETLISPWFGRRHNNVEVVQHLVISRVECHYKFDRSQGKFTLIHSNFLQLKCFFFLTSLTTTVKTTGIVATSGPHMCHLGVHTSRSQSQECLQRRDTHQRHLCAVVPSCEDTNCFGRSSQIKKKNLKYWNFFFFFTYRTVNARMEGRAHLLEKAGPGEV